MTYTSQHELRRAKAELNELIAETKHAIGATALHHYQTLETTFRSNSREERLAVQPGNGPFKRREIINNLRLVEHLPPSRDPDAFGIFSIRTITEQRRHNLAEGGRRAIKLGVARRAIEVDYEYAGHESPKSHSIRLSQNGSTTVTGYDTKPRREEGDLTRQTILPDGSKEGYGSIEELDRNYSITHRTALMAALLVNDDLEKLHGVPFADRNLLGELNDEWYMINGTDPMSEQSILGVFAANSKPPQTWNFF